MSALATCTVVRPNRMHLDEPDDINGFEANEESYSAHILQFENLKAYVVKDNAQKLFWVNVKLLTEITPIV